MLAVSFSPYNSITPDLVAVARERSAKIVTITDSTFSPLVKLSDLWMEVVDRILRASARSPPPSPSAWRWSTALLPGAP